tara:strand:+ start:416 stop:628 length:213 start_codon:yes stop_codon:yes gene_type:complete
MEMFLNMQTLMVFVVALVFTLVGWYMGKRAHVEGVVASAIDSLIEDGYLKTRGDGASMEILTWQEWCANQ